MANQNNKSAQNLLNALNNTTKVTPLDQQAKAQKEQSILDEALGNSNQYNPLSIPKDILNTANNITEGYDNLTTGLANGVDGTIDLANEAVDTVSNKYENAKASAARLFDAATTGASNFTNDVFEDAANKDTTVPYSTGVDKIDNGIVNLQEGINVATSAVDNVAEAATNQFNETFGSNIDTANSVTDTVKGSITNVLDKSVKENAIDAYGAIKGSTKEGTLLGEVGKGIKGAGSELKDGLDSAIGAVAQAGGELGSGVNNVVDALTTEGDFGDNYRNIRKEQTDTFNSQVAFREQLNSKMEAEAKTKAERDSIELAQKASLNPEDVTSSEIKQDELSKLSTEKMNDSVKKSVIRQMKMQTFSDDDVKALDMTKEEYLISRGLNPQSNPAELEKASDRYNQVQEVATQYTKEAKTRLNKKESFINTDTFSGKAANVVASAFKGFGMLTTNALELGSDIAATLDSTGMSQHEKQYALNMVNKIASNGGKMFTTDANGKRTNILNEDERQFMELIDKNGDNLFGKIMDADSTKTFINAIQDNFKRSTDKLIDSSSSEALNADANDWVKNFKNKDISLVDNIKQVGDIVKNNPLGIAEMGAESLSIGALSGVSPIFTAMIMGNTNYQEAIDKDVAEGGDKYKTEEARNKLATESFAASLSESVGDGFVWNRAANAVTFGIGGKKKSFKLDDAKDSAALKVELEKLDTELKDLANSNQGKIIANNKSIEDSKDLIKRAEDQGASKEFIEAGEANVKEIEAVNTERLKEEFLKKNPELVKAQEKEIVKIGEKYTKEQNRLIEKADKYNAAAHKVDKEIMNPKISEANKAKLIEKRQKLSDKSNDFSKQAEELDPQTFINEAEATFKDTVERGAKDLAKEANVSKNNFVNDKVDIEQKIAKVQKEYDTVNRKEVLNKQVEELKALDNQKAKEDWWNAYNDSGLVKKMVMGTSEAVKKTIKGTALAGKGITKATLNATMPLIRSSLGEAMAEGMSEYIKQGGFTDDEPVNMDEVLKAALLGGLATGATQAGHVATGIAKSGSNAVSNATKATKEAKAEAKKTKKEADDKVKASLQAIDLDTLDKTTAKSIKLDTKATPESDKRSNAVYNTSIESNSTKTLPKKGSEHYSAGKDLTARIRINTQERAELEAKVKGAVSNPEFASNNTANTKALERNQKAAEVLSNRVERNVKLLTNVANDPSNSKEVRAAAVRQRAEMYAIQNKAAEVTTEEAVEQLKSNTATDTSKNVQQMIDAATQGGLKNPADIEDILGSKDLNLDDEQIADLKMIKSYMDNVNTYKNFGEVTEDILGGYKDKKGRKVRGLHDYAKELEAFNSKPSQESINGMEILESRLESWMNGQTAKINKGQVQDNGTYKPHEAHVVERMIVERDLMKAQLLNIVRKKDNMETFFNGEETSPETLQKIIDIKTELANTSEVSDEVTETVKTEEPVESVTNTEENIEEEVKTEEEEDIQTTTPPPVAENIQTETALADEVQNVVGYEYDFTNYSDVPFPDVDMEITEDGSYEAMEAYAQMDSIPSDAQPISNVSEAEIAQMNKRYEEEDSNYHNSVNQQNAFNAYKSTVALLTEEDLMNIEAGLVKIGSVNNKTAPVYNTNGTVTFEPTGEPLFTQEEVDYTMFKMDEALSNLTDNTEDYLASVKTSMEEDGSFTPDQVDATQYIANKYVQDKINGKDRTSLGSLLTTNSAEEAELEATNMANLAAYRKGSTIIKPNKDGKLTKAAQEHNKAAKARQDEIKTAEANVTKAQEAVNKDNSKVNKKALTKAKSEMNKLFREIKSLYGKINPIKAYFTSAENKNNILQHNHDVFNTGETATLTEADRQTVISQHIGRKIGEADALLLENYIATTESMREVFDRMNFAAPTTQKGMEWYKYNKLIANMTNSEGKLPANVKEAVMAGMFEFMVTEAESIVNVDDVRQRQIIGMNKESGTVPTEVAEVLRTGGIKPSLLAETLGGIILRNINIKAGNNPEAGTELQTNLVNELGTIGLSILQHPDVGLLEVVDYSAKEAIMLNQAILKAKGGKDNRDIVIDGEAKPHNQYNEISFAKNLRPKVKTEVEGLIEREVLSDEILESKEAFRDSNHSVAKSKNALWVRLFSGVPVENKTPSTVMPTKTQIKVNNSTKKKVLPSDAKVLLEQAQQPHVLRESFNVLASIEDRNPEALQKLLGIQHENNFHITERASRKAANAGLQTEWENIKAYHNVVGNDTSFYLGIVQWVNGRFGLKASDVNPQTSKVQRGLIAMKAWNVDIDISSTANEQHLKAMETFWAGIDEDAGLEKEDFLEGGKAFKHMEAYRNYKSDPSTVSNVELDEMATFVGAKGAMAFNAFNEVSNYLDAVESGTGIFNTDYSVESDGTANGIAHSQVQTMPKSMFAAGLPKDVFQKYGIFLAGSEYTNTAEYKADGGLDVYQDLSSILATSLVEVSEFSFAAAADWDERMPKNEPRPIEVTEECLEGLAALIPNTPSFLRNLAKPVLMLKNYSASMENSLVSVADKFVEEVYSSLNEISKIKDATAKRNALHALEVNVRKAIKAKPDTVIFDKAGKSDLSTVMFAGNVEHELRKHVRASYGKSFENSLKEHYQTIDDSRAVVLKAFGGIGRIQEVLYAKATEDTKSKELLEGKIIPGASTISNKSHKEIRDMIDGLGPKYNTFEALNEVANVMNGDVKELFDTTKGISDVAKAGMMDNTLEEYNIDLHNWKKDTNHEDAALVVELTTLFNEADKKLVGAQNTATSGSSNGFSKKMVGSVDILTYGAGGAVIPTHATDARSILRAYARNYDMMGVHDATYEGLLNKLEAVVATNEDLINIMLQENLNQQVLYSYDRSMVRSQAYAEEMGYDWDSIIKEAHDLKVNGRTFETIVKDDNGNNEELSPEEAYEKTRGDLLKEAIDTKETKEAVLKNIRHMDHFSHGDVNSSASTIKEVVKPTNKDSIVKSQEVMAQGTEETTKVLLQESKEEEIQEEIAKADSRDTIETLTAENIAIMEDLNVVDKEQDNSKVFGATDSIRNYMAYHGLRDARGSVIRAYKELLKVIDKSQTLNTFSTNNTEFGSGLFNNVADKAVDTISEEDYNNLSEDAKSVHKLIKNNGEMSRAYAEVESTMFGSKETNGFDSNEYDKIEDMDATNTVAVFDNLPNSGSKVENSAHLAKLRGLVSHMSAKITKPASLFIKDSSVEDSFGAYKDGNIYISNLVKGAKATSGMLNQGLKMSNHEIMAHELNHLVFAEGIRAHSRYQGTMKRMFDAAKAQLDYTAFLDPNVTPTTDEVTRAKEAFEYMFYNPKGNQLVEFGAFGTTNEHFINALDSVDVTPTKIFEGSIYNVISNVLYRVVDAVNSGLYMDKTDNKNSEALLTLLDNMNQVSGSKQGMIAKSLNSLTEVPDYATDKVVEGVQGIGKSIIESDWVSQSDNGVAVMLRAGRNTRNYLEGDKKFTDMITYLRDSIGDQHTSVASAIASDFIGRNNVNAKARDLLRKSVLSVDSARIRAKNSYIDYLRKGFLTEVNEQDEETLGAGLINTDVSALLNNGRMSLNDVTEVMGNEKALNRNISALRAEIGLYKHSAEILAHTENLGQFQVTGKSKMPLGMMNAHVISNMAIDPSIKIDEDTALKLEPLIDELASLYAIKENGYAVNQKTANIIRQEMAINPTDNGVTKLLIIHQDLKNQAVDLFDDAKAYKVQGVKGYYKEDYRSEADMVQATLEEHDSLIAKGYTRVSDNPIGKDPTHPDFGATTTDMYLYVAPNGDLSSTTSAIFDLTNTTSKGTDFADVLEAGGDETAYTGKRAKVNEITANKLKSGHKANSVNNSVPILSPDGTKITGYRYLMSEGNKKKFLAKDMNAVRMMGATIATAIGKTESTKLNREAVETLKTMYDAEMNDKSKLKIGDNYISVGPLSQDAKTQEMWALLPQDTKDEIISVFGLTGLKIRKENVPYFFGQRLPSAKDLFATDSKSESLYRNIVASSLVEALGEDAANKVSKAEDIVKAVVAETKDIIVVRSIVVSMANIISNTYGLIGNGVPVVEALKGQAQGYIGSNKLRADLREKDRLTLELKQTSDPVKTKRLNAEIAAVQRSIESNPVYGTYSNGLMPNMVDDVQLNLEYGNDLRSKTHSKISKTIDKYGETLPTFATDFVKGVLGVADSDSYKMAANLATQSDFIARHTMLAHETKKAVAEKGSELNAKETNDLVAKAEEAFVNFNAPTNSTLEYLNQIGLMFFYKFGARTMRPVLEMVTQNPKSALTMLLGGELTGLDTYGNSIFGTVANGVPVLESVANPASKALGALELLPVFNALGGVSK